MSVPGTLEPRARRPAPAWHRLLHAPAGSRNSWNERAARFIAAHGDAVQAGPFQGMRLSPLAASWEGCAVIPWLCGAHNREIHPWLARHRGPFVHIGYAEGACLTGMARRGCKAVGFDIDPTAAGRARHLARLNDVDVEVRGGFSPARVNLGGALVLIDIGGVERALIPMHAPSFIRSRLIVAFHGGSEGDVIRALQGTHSMTMVPGPEPSDPPRPEQHPQLPAWGVFEPLR